MRAAFDDLTISRGVIVVEGDYVACQTTTEADSPRNGCRRTTEADCASWAPKDANGLRTGSAFPWDRIPSLSERR
jgi:hypothetical protein